jgi:hypothetical protein
MDIVNLGVHRCMDSRSHHLYRAMSRASAYPNYRYSIELLFAVLGVLLCANASAESEIARKSLAHIAPVAVFVGKLPDWVENGAITREALRESAQTQLHQAGIPIAPNSTGAGADLVIVVRGGVVAIPRDEKIREVYLYVSSLGVVQKVRLTNTNEDSMAVTWTSEQYGFVSSSPSAALRDVQTALHKNIEKFIADYNYATSTKDKH